MEALRQTSVCRAHAVQNSVNGSCPTNFSLPCPRRQDSVNGSCPTNLSLSGPRRRSLSMEAVRQTQFVVPTPQNSVNGSCPTNFSLSCPRRRTLSMGAVRQTSVCRAHAAGLCQWKLSTNSVCRAHAAGLCQWKLSDKLQFVVSTRQNSVNGSCPTNFSLSCPRRRTLSMEALRQTKVCRTCFHPFRYLSVTSVHFPCAFRISSTTSRTAPLPPRAWVT